VRSNALGAFERRSTVERRSARSNVVLVIPQSAVGFHRFQAAPYLFAAIERSAFERTSCVRTHSVEFLPINKTLDHLVGYIVFGGVFGEHFAPPLLVPLLLFVSFYSTFNFNALFHFNYALLFNG
jgi:hypothetical protein